MRGLWLRLAATVWDVTGMVGKSKPRRGGRVRGRDTRKHRYGEESLRRSSRELSATRDRPRPPPLPRAATRDASRRPPRPHRAPHSCARPDPAQFLQLRLLGGQRRLVRLQQRILGAFLRSPSLPLRCQLLLQRYAAGTVAGRSRRLRCYLPRHGPEPLPHKTYRPFKFTPLQPLMRRSLGHRIAQTRPVSQHRIAAPALPAPHHRHPHPVPTTSTYAA